MAYDYKTQRAAIFTEDGVKMLLEMRDKARRLLKEAGAFNANAVMGSGDSWLALAVLDYMVERGEVQKVYTGGAAQDWVFTK